MNKNLAEIQYMGEGGISASCVDAIIRLLQNGDTITKARLITNLPTHAFLLTIHDNELIAIKSGFSSGYGGSGPSALSYILKLLESFGVSIRECEVEIEIIERLDSSALTVIDIELIMSSDKARGVKWADYIFEEDWNLGEEGKIWKRFQTVIPYKLLDARLTDLALNFWDNPDEKLLTAYRRLEDIVRRRSGINEHGYKLFSSAFRHKMTWVNMEEPERIGRMNLFTGAYMAYRNPRAHKEQSDGSKSQLNEFLLINNLFLLERESVDVLVNMIDTDDAAKEF